MGESSLYILNPRTAGALGTSPLTFLVDHPCCFSFFLSAHCFVPFANSVSSSVLLILECLRTQFLVSSLFLLSVTQNFYTPRKESLRAPNTAYEQMTPMRETTVNSRFGGPTIFLIYSLICQPGIWNLTCSQLSSRHFPPNFCQSSLSQKMAAVFSVG